MYEPTPENLPERWKISFPQENRSLPEDGGQSAGGAPPQAPQSKRTGLTIRLYILLDPRYMTVRYVGKTSGTLVNRLRGHINTPRNIHVAAWVRSLTVLGLKPIIQEIEVIENSNDLDWQERERFWIAKYKSEGCSLTNLDSGGTGGKLHHEETKKKIGDAHRGRVHTEETKEKFRQSHLGKKLSPEHVASMSRAVKGKPRGKYSAERVEKTASKLRGKKKPPRTPEHQAKLTAQQIGRKRSEETRAKISAAQKGRVLSPEHREKMRLAALRRWNRPNAHPPA